MLKIPKGSDVLKCQKCEKIFSVLEDDDEGRDCNRGGIPLLFFACKHLICDKCCSLEDCKKSEDTYECVLCKSCGEVSVHLALLGASAYLHSVFGDDDIGEEGNGNVDYGNDAPVIICGLCKDEKSAATCYCPGCHLPFCSLCYLDHHKASSGYASDTHYLVKIKGIRTGDSDDERESTECKEHKKKFGMACTPCGVKICIDCLVIGDHKGHIVEYLNENEAVDVEKAKEEGLHKLSLLTAALSLMPGTSPCSAAVMPERGGDGPVQRLTHNIHTIFLTLLTHIQHRYFELLREVEAYKDSSPHTSEVELIDNISDVRSAKMSVANAIVKTKLLLRDVQLFEKQPENSNSLPRLAERLMQPLEGLPMFTIDKGAPSKPLEENGLDSDGDECEKKSKHVSR